MMKIFIPIFSFVILLMTGCTQYKPIKTVENVDLNRFMGKWYVIANIPTFIETEAYNAIETYEIREDARIQTTFEFNKGSFDGEKIKYSPVGRVLDDTNAIWGMQFIWPFEADYRIIYLDKNYENTVIGRIKRDYVWLMSRNSQVDEKTYQEIVESIKLQGYDVNQLQRVPQSKR